MNNSKHNIKPCKGTKSPCKATTKQQQYNTLGGYIMTYLFLFFEQFNSELYVNFTELKHYLKYSTKELKQIMDFLDKYTEKHSAEDINTYYFNEYFSFRKENGFLSILNITQFLDFAVNDFDGFVEDITDTMKNI